MRLAWLVLVLAACSKEPRGGSAGATAPPPAVDAGADPCVAECVKKNQMRATSPEQIERDCRAECTGQPP